MTHSRSNCKTAVLVCALVCVLMIQIGGVHAQFGNLFATKCAGTSPNRCPAGSVCPENFADPSNNLATAAADGLRDFEVEGKINAIDPARRIAVVNGFQIKFPASLTTFDTGKLPSDTPTLVTELRASDLGATLIVTGRFTLDDNGCVEMRAETAFFEVAENVVVGQLSKVDVANNTFYVGSTPCIINDDPRFPRYVINVNGEVVNVDGLPKAAPTAADIRRNVSVLTEALGTIVGVEGYFDATIGKLKAIVVETELWPPITSPLGVTIAVNRYRLQNDRFRIVMDVLCLNQSLCLEQRLEVRLGTTETNACANVNTIANIFFSPPFPGAAGITLVNGYWDTPYSIDVRNGGLPASVCVTTRSTTVTITGPSLSVLLSAPFE